MNTKVYLLCGLIGSGKSTYCKSAALNGHIILNDDAIVNLLHCDNYTLYDKKLKILYKSIENSIVSLSLCMGKSIVIDRGLNISKKGRKRFIALAQSFDIPCFANVFKNEGVETHAMRRYNSDNRGHTYEYWLNVAKKHNEIWEFPTIEEGFNEIHEIKYEDICQQKY